MAALGLIGGALQGVGTVGSHMAEAGFQNDLNMQHEDLRQKIIGEREANLARLQREAIAAEGDKNRAIESQRLAETTRSNTARETEAARHDAATELIQGRLTKSSEVDTALKQIALDNARRVQDLQKAYGQATDPDQKQSIVDQIHLLTGKDKDKFLPVPLKDEMGSVTGYQIFDTTRGQFINGAAPQGAANRPPLSSFGAQQQPAARTAPQPAAQAPAEPSPYPSDYEFDVMASDAARGGETGTNYLRQKLTDPSQLTLGQRLKAQQALGGR